MSARQVQDHVRREGWRVAVPVAAGDHWQHEYWRDIVWRPPATILNSQRIFWWKSQFGVDYKESFLVIIWICIVPRQIILKIWLCQCCYCTFLWEYLLDDLLFLNEYIFALLTYILIKIEKFPPWVLEKTNVWVHVLCACIREGRVFYLLKARKHWTAFDI